MKNVTKIVCAVSLVGGLALSGCAYPNRVAMIEIPNAPPPPPHAVAPPPHHECDADCAEAVELAAGAAVDLLTGNLDAVAHH